MKTNLISLSHILLMRLGINAVIAMALTLAANAEEKVRSADTDSANALSTPHIQSNFIPKTSSIRSIPALAFTRTYGTALHELLTGIRSDSLGNVYIVGNSMDGNSNGFILKYSPQGTLLWKIHKPTISVDGLTLDKNNNAYVAGSYATSSAGSIRHSIYLDKYDGDGNLIWTKFFRASAAPDPTYMFVNGLAIDPRGNEAVIILFERAEWPYQNRGVFIRKYNTSGAPIWEKPAGGSGPYSSRPVLATDNYGRIYTAINSISYQRWNTIITQFNAQGNRTWSKPFSPTDSTLENSVHGISVDSTGNPYVIGVTKANLEQQNLGSFDAFIRKYDDKGNILWTRQFGTAANDYANSLTIDAADNVYVAGSTDGVLKSKNRGSFDAIVRKYGSNGSILNSMQFGTIKFDIANGIRLDATGNLFVAGHTYAHSWGRNMGGQDVYLRKYVFK